MEKKDSGWPLEFSSKISGAGPSDYLGLGTSGLTLITCLGYLVFFWARAKKVARTS